MQNTLKVTVALLIVLVVVSFGTAEICSAGFSGPNLAFVEESNISSSSAAITWVSETACAGRVEYGTTPDLGLIVEEQQAGHAHFVWLTGLPPNENVYYRVLSYRSASIVLSFRTSSVEAGLPKAIYGAAPQMEPGDPAVTRNDVIVKLRLTDHGDLSLPLSVRTPDSDLWLLNLGNLKTGTGGVFPYGDSVGLQTIRTYGTII